MRTIIALLILPLLCIDVMASVRVKDVTTVRGIRSNHLVGYGLVIGLNGTGDNLRNAPFTSRSIRSMLDRMGININAGDGNTRNIAGVMVTASLPPFAAEGNELDVTVSSLGDATSLEGGTLVITPLSGADKQVYAVAQGSVAIHGVRAEGRAQKITQGTPTTARIPNGAIVERAAPFDFTNQGYVILDLRNPDFETSSRIVSAINEYTIKMHGAALARELNPRSVQVKRPAGVYVSRFLAELGQLSVEPDVAARVVVDARSGTIVIGKDVRISSLAIAHGNIAVRISEFTNVSQPLPFSKGQTVVSPETSIDIMEKDSKLAILKGASLRELVSGLNQVGLKPQDIIAVLQAIKSSGAMHAELVIQ